ncbi:hypothetical protein VTL71DRAFT_7059 [Oculimacula yallundae]|uniref:Uncharacterized protein n=1 Tax=Oculimacula yallundae TaxID=86028 RepID=A0ABR4BWG4_9HELO
MQMLDPNTLEPIGIASQSVLHPDLKGPSSGTHAKSDPETGDVFNYNLEFKKGTGYYRVFRSNVSTGKTSILALLVGDPAYVHSISLTKTYVILYVWNARFTYGGASVLWTKNIVDSPGPYDQDRKCMWYALKRKVVKVWSRRTHLMDLLFPRRQFIRKNDLDGKTDIIPDLIAYPNLDVVKRYYIDNLISDSHTAAVFSEDLGWRPSMRRFRLPTSPQHKNVKTAGVASGNILKAISEHTTDWKISPELPTINPRMVFKKHRCVYGLDHIGKSTLFDNLAKHDLETHTNCKGLEPAWTSSERSHILFPIQLQPRTMKTMEFCLLW